MIKNGNIYHDVLKSKLNSTPIERSKPSENRMKNKVCDEFAEWNTGDFGDRCPIKL
jgi:hypothetical protein